MNKMLYSKYENFPKGAKIDTTNLQTGERIHED